MKYDRFLFALSILSILGVFLGNIYSNARLYGICLETDPACRFAADRFGDPLLAGSFALLLISTILIALPNSVFRTWLWFGGWYVPLALIILAFYPEPRGMNFSPSLEQMTFYVTSIFIWVSLAVIFSAIMGSFFKK